MIANALNNLFRGAALSFDGNNPRDPAIAKLLGMSTKTNAGVVVDEEKVLGYPAVWRGVNILANGVSKVRPIVYRRTSTGKEKDTSHPSYRTITRKASPEMCAGVFRGTLQHHALMWGNGLGYIFRNSRGEVDPIKGIVPLVPSKTRLVRLRGGHASTHDLADATSGELVYVTMIGNTKHRLLPDNVLHLKGLGFNGLWGYPVVELLRESLAVGLAARDFGARFFGQGSTASGIVTLPAGLDEEAEENFLNSIHKAHAGLGSAHRLMLLEDGAKFQQTTIPPEHAQFLQTREFEIREIANIIGVQPHKLGDPSRKSFNSLEQSNQEHLDDDLDPWLGRWEEELEDKLLTERQKDEDSHFVEFNRNALMRTNLAARTAHYASGRQWGYLSANDIRRKENMDDIGDSGDIYLQPSNMVDVASQQPVIAPAPPPANNNAKELALWHLRSTWSRLCKQATKKATDSKAFLEWLDTLSVHPDCPKCLREASEGLITDLRARLCDVVERVTAEELPKAVAAAINEDRTEKYAEKVA